MGSFRATYTSTCAGSITGVWVIPELRSQTRKTRFRLPDVTVTLVPPQARYLVDAAFLAVEVLSEDDPMSKVIEKLEEYSEKRVANIWLIDPRLEKMFIYRAHALGELQVVIATENPAWSSHARKHFDTKLLEKENLTFCVKFQAASLA